MFCHLLYKLSEQKFVNQNDLQFSSSQLFRMTNHLFHYALTFKGQESMLKELKKD